MARTSHKQQNPSLSQSCSEQTALYNVAIYARLSVEDNGKNPDSIESQISYLEDYIAKGLTMQKTAVFIDNGFTGTNFMRPEFQRMIDTVRLGKINCVVVNDLSRLGRHKTQTALFIDYLRKHDVRVLSVTENIDTSNEDDELMVGFKGIFNDMYCRDISKKIRAGYKQKQKKGIVLIPPMGYFKDRNTGEVVIVEEQAAIFRRISTGMRILCLLSYQERYGSRHNFYSATMWSAMSAPDRTLRITAIRG